MTWHEAAPHTQAFLVRGIWGLDSAAYCFVSLGPGHESLKRARDLGYVRSAAQGATRVGDGEHAAKVNVNIALTPAGLKKLGVSYDSAGSSKDDAFSMGMWARQKDELDEDPETADWTWRTDSETAEIEIDALYIVSAGSDEIRDRVRDEIFAGCEGERLFVRNSDAGLAEPFGFDDGSSQPRIEGIHNDHEPGGRLLEDLSWRPLKLGEFLLGHEPEDNTLQTDRPAPWSYVGPTLTRNDAELPPALVHNSTYLVFRVLEQHVDAWQKIVGKGGDYNDDRAAKLMGRYPRDHSREDLRGRSTTAAPNRENTNDFTYVDDALGFGCPIGAHIRRSFPRDALHHPELATHHRMIRRGRFYEDGDEEVGLNFVAVVGSIEEQFEFVQREWLNRGPTAGVGQDPDFIAGIFPASKDGQPVVKFVIPDPQRPEIVTATRPLVTTRGGGYFLVPSLPLLDNLVRHARH